MSLSVIIPFYDEFIYFRQTLRSVFEAGDAIGEVIIINDGANDRAEEFLLHSCRDPRIRIIHNADNLGAARSRNIGLEQAECEYVLCLDSDDLLSESGLREALELAQSSEADITHLPTYVHTPHNGGYVKFHRDRALFGKLRRTETVESFPEIRYATAGWSLLFRTRYVAENAVRFDPEQRKFEDHLFVLRATQPARSIAASDKWVHVWRHRGGSLSSSPLDLNDFDLQIKSLEKSHAYLRRFYQADDLALQRDVLFTFSRFLTIWPSLIESILIRHEAPEAAQRLEKFAATAASTGPILRDIAKDPILRRIIYRRITTAFGGDIDQADLPDIYAQVCDRAWSKLQETLAPNHASSRSHGKRVFRGHDEKPSPALTEIASQTRLSCSEQLWRQYRALLEDSGENEQRLFSEFVLDEIDRCCSTSALAQDKLGTVRPALSQSIPELVRALELAIRRRTHRSSDNPVSGRNEATRAEVRPLYEAAIAATDAYPTAGSMPSRANVAFAWREVEECVLHEELNGAFAGQIELIDQMRFGDADFFGRRTFRSRARHRVKRVLGLS